MPRLLYVSTVAPFLWGFLRPFASYFRAKGWQVDGMARGIWMADACRELFSETWEAGWSRDLMKPGSAANAVRELRRVVMRGDYDIVHVHTPVAAFLTRYALRDKPRYRKPVVIYTAHGFHFHPLGSPGRNCVFRSMEKLAGRWTDYLIVINREDESAVIRHGIVPATRLRYIPGIGIDVARYSRAAVPPFEVARVRGELGMGPGDAMIVMLAEFSPGKRHRDVLNALARLGRPDIHLALAGYGKTQQAVERQAERLGLRGRVHFLGLRHDIPALLRSAAALVLPSEREGLSRTVMEALSMAVPVVASDIRGIRDLVGEDAGILLQPGDVPALAKAISSVVDHPDAAACMAQRGPGKVAPFAIERVLDAHFHLYEHALAGAGCTGVCA